MCPHMVTFVVSGFGRSPSTNRLSADSRANVNVFAPSDLLDQVQYVTGEAPALLRTMEDFTQVQYDLPGLDLFAVPDLKSEASGNWGLNTFRYGNFNEISRHTKRVAGSDTETW